MKKITYLLLAALLLIVSGCKATTEQTIEGNNDQITIGVHAKLSDSN